MNGLTAMPLTKRPGRPPSCPPEVVEHIVLLWRAGLSLQEIGNVLNAEGVPTPAGRSRWTKSHVDRLLHARHVQDVVAALSGRS